MARISTDKVSAALHFVSAIVVLCFVFLSSCKDYSTGPTKNTDSTTVSPGYGKDTTVFAPASMRVGTKDSIIISNWRGDASFLDFKDIFQNVREGRASVYFGTRRIPILSLAYDSLKKHTVVCFIAQPSTEHIQQPDTYVKQFLSLGVYMANEIIYYTSKTATTLVYPQGQARSVSFSLSGLSIVNNMTRVHSSTSEPTTTSTFSEKVDVMAMMMPQQKPWEVIEYPNSTTALFYPSRKELMSSERSNGSLYIVYTIEEKPTTVSVSIRYVYVYGVTEGDFGSPWRNTTTRFTDIQTELLVKDYPKSASWPKQNIVLRASDFASRLQVDHKRRNTQRGESQSRYGSSSSTTVDTLDSFDLVVDPAAELTIELK